MNVQHLGTLVTFPLPSIPVRHGSLKTSDILIKKDLNNSRAPQKRPDGRSCFHRLKEEEVDTEVLLNVLLKEKAEIRLVKMN
jgi:hypothetical protein